MINSSSRCSNVSLKKGGAVKEKSHSDRERNVWSDALQVRSPDLTPDLLLPYYETPGKSFHLSIPLPTLLSNLSNETASSLGQRLLVGSNALGWFC